MPFTFFAHQAPVIPLKWARPKWFDGTALCVGSMAPDLSYVFDGTRLAFASHTIAQQFLWTVPLSVALTLTWRRCLAREVARALPGRWGDEVSALTEARRPLALTAVSALVGGLSHIFIDGFTHQNGWAAARW